MGPHSEMRKAKLRKGLWSPEEDEKLYNYISRYGVGCWSAVPKLAGLERCGKSCRLRWMNYLRPDLKRGMFSQQEEDLIISLHQSLGNRWAQISAQLPGRTDNEIKNFWNSYLKKKLMKQGIDPNTHKPIGKREEKEGRNSPEKPPVAFPLLKVEVGPNWPCVEQEVHVANYTNQFGSKPNFDPLILYEFQGSFDSNGYNSNLLTHYHQTHLEGSSNFGFTPTDFSDNSSSMISSFSLNEVKQSSSNSSNVSIVENNATVSWGQEKLGSVFGFQFNGIKCEEMEPSTLWPEGQSGHNTEAFSSYPLTSVSSENFDFSSKY